MESDNATYNTTNGIRFYFEISKETAYQNLRFHDLTVCI